MVPGNLPVNAHGGRKDPAPHTASSAPPPPLSLLELPLPPPGLTPHISPLRPPGPPPRPLSKTQRPHRQHFLFTAPFPVPQRSSR